MIDVDELNELQEGRPVDVIIYGATGYTGQLCLQHLDMLLSLPGASSPTVAIAGRDYDRLLTIAKKCKTDVLVYPVTSPEELSDMVADAKLVFSCVGPYSECGEAVIEACVRHGTHYMDVSFEQVWMHDMIEKYHSAAKEQGVMLIFSAGSDSASYEIMAYKLVQELGPVKDMTMYNFQYGFGSGGTARSRLAAIKKMSDKKAFEITNDPFNLGGLRRQGNRLRVEHMDCAIPEQDTLFESLWLFPVVRTANVRIMRRTCELFDATPSDGVLYGQDFLVKVRDAAPNQKAAQLGSDAAQGKPCLKREDLPALIEDVEHSIEKFAPPQGLGNTKEMRGLHYSKVFAVAKGESGEWAYVEHDSPDAFEVTAICIAAGVLTFLEELDTMKPAERGGCVTPAYAFHNTRWIERIEQHAMADTQHRRCMFTVHQGTPDLAVVKRAMFDRSTNAMKGQVQLQTGVIRMWGHPPLADKEFPEEEEEEEEVTEKMKPEQEREVREASGIAELQAIAKLPESGFERIKPAGRIWVVLVSLKVRAPHQGGPLLAEKLQEELPADAELEEVELAGTWLLFKNKSAKGPKEGWAQTEQDAEALIAPKPLDIASLKWPRKEFQPRVLVLHGIASGKDISSMQLSRLIDKGRGMVDFFFLEGQKQCDDQVAVSRMSGVFPGKNKKMYASVFLDKKGWRCFKKVREALISLQRLVKMHGPFDAVMGYSQGAAFATMLAAQAAQGLGANLPTVICLSPQAPGYVAQVPELFSVPLPNRALIVRGVQEEYNKQQEWIWEGRPYWDLGEKKMSDHVVKLFKKAHVYTHPDGHFALPSDLAEKDKAIDCILDFVCGNPWKPQEDVPTGTVDSRKPASAKKVEEEVEVVLDVGDRKKLIRDFKKAPVDVRGDPEQVLKIVKMCGAALEFATSDCQGIPEIVLAAVAQDGFALEYASDELKKDSEIVSAAVRQDGWALEFAHKSLQDNVNVVKEAVSSTWKALRFASSRTRRNEEIMSMALEQSKEAEQYAAA